MMRTVHRFTENDAGTRRLEESMIVDPDKLEDYPDWVGEALAAQDAVNAEAGEDPLKRRLESFDPDSAVANSEPAATIAWVAVKRKEAEDGERPEGQEAATADDEDDEDDDAAPPKGGAGSGLKEWARYAQSKNVQLTDGMTRDEIIAACEAAGVPTE